MVNNYSNDTNEQLIEKRNTALHYLSKINRGYYIGILDEVFLYYSKQSHELIVKNIINELNERAKKLSDKNIIKELENKLQELENNITIFKEKLKHAIAQ